MSSPVSKRHGRFIKNDDPVRKVLKISEFNLMDICDKPFTFHDNAGANVIHQRLHSEDELADGIRNSHEINAAFPHESRPVIRPLDFTDEWRRQKRRMANRNHRLDDEEELDLDGSIADSKIDLFNAKYSLVEPENRPSDPFFRTMETSLAEPIAPPSHETVTNSGKVSPPQPSAAEQLAAARALETAAIRPAAVEPSISRPAADEFIPMATAPSTYHSPVIDEAELEAIREAARSEGYQLGFNLGEEKGTMQAQQKIHAIIDELGAMMENLQGMQSSILNNVQDNFKLICQSFIESLLHKEFRLDPDAFGKVIERAIAEAMPEDEYRIIVSPKAFSNLSQWSNHEMRKHLKSDDNMGEHQFRIEGKHAVVDAKLSEIIKNLLDKADLRLFDDETQEKAS